MCLFLFSQQDTSGSVESSGKSLILKEGRQKVALSASLFFSDYNADLITCSQLSI